MGWGTERKLEGWSALAPKFTSLADNLRPSKGLLTREGRNHRWRVGANTVGGV